jgi:Holliday junction resolvase
MINSKEKGAAGERELSHYLAQHGVQARRGQQFSGSKESPDVVSDLESIHIECKRVEAGNPYTWLAQAERDAGTKIPVVFHRRNKQKWIVVLGADDFLNYFTKDFRSDKEP